MYIEILGIPTSDDVVVMLVKENDTNDLSVIRKAVMNVTTHNKLCAQLFNCHV